MSAKIIPINHRVEIAWAEYLDRKAIAERTGLIDDGIELGKAYRRFLDLFLTDDQRKSIGDAR